MEYSLLQRGVEREVLPAALDLGVGLLPSSPLGRGVLTGKYRQGTPADSRGGSADMAAFVAPYLDETARLIVDVAGDSGRRARRGPAARRPGVGTGPARGRRADRRRAQRRAAHGALSVEGLTLPEEICQALDDVSAPLHRYPDHDWTTL